MMRSLLVVLLLCCAGLRAADAPASLDAEGKKKAEALIKDLASDSFDARNNAEKELATLMPAATDLIKENLASAKDAEVKTRLEKILKMSALESVNDPDLLAKYGKEEATAKHYETASKFYEKAAKLYGEQLVKAQDEAAKKEVAEKQEKAAARQKRARILGKNANANQPQVVIQGGGGGAAAGGGVVVISRIEVSDDSGAAVDLKSEDW